nr:MAG TPA: hypothetical protein [Caudoviricetes sp.]
MRQRKHQSILLLQDLRRQCQSTDRYHHRRYPIRCQL